MAQRQVRASRDRRVRMRRAKISSSSSTASSSISHSATPASTTSLSSAISSSQPLSTASSSSTRSFDSASSSSTSHLTSSSLAASVSSSTISRTRTSASSETPLAVPTSTGSRVRPPSANTPDRYAPDSSSSSPTPSSYAGPLYTPLILAPDAPSSSSPPSSTSLESSPQPSGKRSVGGVSMGVGVLIGALALAALLIPAFFVYRKVSRSRRARAWNRRRRLTHIDPGAHVGEHIEKYPVSPFVVGQPAARPMSVMYISDAGSRDEESRTPRSGATPMSSNMLLVPSRSPGSTSSPGNTPSPNPSASSRTARPAALELGRARSGTAQTVRQSTADGAVEFTLGASPPPPASGSALASTTAVPSAAAPKDKRSSIEKRPARTLVAQNALSPLPTPLVTPAPRYSQSPPTLWARLSAIRQSVVPPAYESPRPHQTTHLQVPPSRSHLRSEVPTQEDPQEGPELEGIGWAPLRIQRRGTREDAPRLPRQSFDGRGRI